MPWILQRQEKGCYSTLPSQDTGILSGAPCLCLLHQGAHTPPHQEMRCQFQEAIISWAETGNNIETPDHSRGLHFLAVSLVVWPHHHLQIRPPGLPSHPC